MLANFEKYVPQIIDVAPDDWKGTTFKNTKLLGREAFAENVKQLLSEKQKNNESISTQDILQLGNAEDYLRVATNFSTLLELFLAEKYNYEVAQVFSFASSSMPLVSVLLTVNQTVNLYIQEHQKNICWKNELAVLEHLGCKLVCHTGDPKPHPNEIVLVQIDSNGDFKNPHSQVDGGFIDGITTDNILFICNSEKIRPNDILVIRKRMATPVTTPTAIAMLQHLSHIPVTLSDRPPQQQMESFLGALQLLSGTEVDLSAPPVLFTAGLPTTCSIYLTLIEMGGADIVICSTAYGGSNQLLDIVTSKGNKMLRKHAFNIQGDINIDESIEATIDDLIRRQHDDDDHRLMPRLVLFIEIPTNPDMKVPNLKNVAASLQRYHEKTGKEVLLMIDTTFSPNSRVLSKVKAVDDTLACVVFISMSKSISGGYTTAGALVANHTEQAKLILGNVGGLATTLDTIAKNDQLQVLVQRHGNVEERIEKAYLNALAASEYLFQQIKEYRKQEIQIKFVSASQAADGYKSATFSFNLPPPLNSTPEMNEQLAQRFVDLLCLHSQFKPCVSFGQDNELIYATVPATSTQGAISDADKGKQAVDGVQLVRLSFPPALDLPAVYFAFTSSVKEIYNTH